MLWFLNHFCVYSCLRCVTQCHTQVQRGGQRDSQSEEFSHLWKISLSRGERLGSCPSLGNPKQNKSSTGWESRWNQLKHRHTDDITLTPNSHSLFKKCFCTILISTHRVFPQAFPNVWTAAAALKAIVWSHAQALSRITVQWGWNVR